MKKNRSYKIIHYNPKWPALFSNESKKVRKVIGDNILETHHIGSTSVPGMSGKSTIDLLFVVQDISKISKKIVNMKKIGYSSFGSRNAKKSHLFEKEKNGNRTYIVHFYPKNHPEIKQIIALKDYLRNHKDMAREYSEIKLSLFHKFPNDYKQYRKIKDEYMSSLKSKAISWFARNNSRREKCKNQNEVVRKEKLQRRLRLKRSCKRKNPKI